MSEAVLALFLCAGYFKGSPAFAWIPFDLTIGAAIALIMSVSIRFVSTGFRVPVATLLMALLFLSCAPALLWTEWHPYAREKASRFFTLTFLAGIAPTFLLRTNGAARRLTAALAFAGFAMAISSVQAASADTGALRVTAFQSTTIALGRAAGISVLWLLLHAPLRGRRYWASMGASAFLMLALLISGSRGPIIATAFTLILCRVVFGNVAGHAPHRAIFKFAVLLLVGFLSVLAAQRLAPEGAVARVSSFVQGDFGTSELTRLNYATRAGEALIQNPAGIGFGGFASRVLHTGGDYREFPHNIVLEIFLECGWIAGIVFLGLFVAATIRVARASRRSDSDRGLRVVFAILVFLFVNDLVSGELNDSKMLFAIIGAGLSVVTGVRNATLQNRTFNIRPSAGGSPDFRQAMSFNRSRWL